MNQTYSRRGPAEARNVSVALRYETSGSAAFSAPPGGVTLGALLLALLLYQKQYRLTLFKSLS